MTMTVEQAGLTVVDPSAYAEEHRLHEACAILRRESPVHWVDGSPDYNPFWVITRRADILEIEKNHEVFRNHPRPVLVPAYEDKRQAEQGQLLRTLIHIDDPDHKALRPIAADWFRPKTLRTMQENVNELARRYIDLMAERGGECDFVADVSVHYPLSVILSLLGLPESDFPRMLQLTQEIFGGDDPERRRGEDPEAMMAVVLDFFAYFQQLIANRRENPTEDLASAIANARIDGEYLSDIDAASYFVIIATAGHDTTSSTIAGGMHALVQHPEQLEKLRADPSLLPGAVEEIIRWVTPVKEFMRTASRDYEIGGVTIKEGQSLLLMYPSGNRDEAEFDRPDEFDITRRPNRHVAFGAGVHFCLGAQLARMETQAIFGELLPRLEHVELAGPVTGVHSTFVSGLKQLPLRYRMRDAVDA
ncbi:cytochrome P450 [Pseudonocardia spinosispora]|uniref:cytochrome P450 n=1 Tax=Pseudonocardia spinosispora TaxID=103441 RepID=UPI0004214FC9|nr:cytochrome P450 [Pseudonocardia spinosispora]